MREIARVVFGLEPYLTPVEFLDLLRHMTGWGLIRRCSRWLRRGTGLLRTDRQDPCFVIPRALRRP